MQMVSQAELARTIRFTVLIVAGSLLSTTSVLGQVPVDPPAAYGAGISKNYIRLWEASAPLQTPAAILNAPLKEVKQATRYFDGLGRLLQTVVKKGSLITDTNDPSSSANAVDLVTPVVYDQFGREQYKYLPFAANNTGSNPNINNGVFKFNPFQQQAAFAAVQYPGETFFYGKTNFEPSPLHRISDNYASGNSWAGSEANGNPALRRSTATQYLVNTVDDEVHVWSLSGASFETTSMYAAGQLFKIVTTDEHKNKTIEYKDKDGKLVLAKKQIVSTPADNHNGWLCTYYIYDDLDSLRGVLQPKAVDLLKGSGWTMTPDILNELCFVYEYDEDRRMISKKVPGGGEVRMVYDSRDRLVLWQDANLRATDKWIYTKYDETNRIVVTGFYTGPAGYTQQQMATLVNSSGLALYEERNGSTFVGYTLNQSFPVTTTADVLTITYYDDYTWSGWYGPQYGAKDNSYDHLFSSNFSSAPYPEPLSQSSNTRGLITGTWNKVLGTSTGIVTASFYDIKGRVVQTKSYNLLQGTDITTTQYSFHGKILQTVLYQDKPGTNLQNHRITSNMQYDDLWRLINIAKTVTSTVNGQTITKPQVEIVKNEYDALGQLKYKKLGKQLSGGNYTNTPIETLEYTYNIHGWLLGANRDYATAENNTSRYFGFDIGYNKPLINAGGNTIGSYDFPAYNGNAAGTVWKSKGDNKIRKYDFTYDIVNRLTSAGFKEYGGSQFGTSDIDFSVSNITYDANGNLLTMQQKGWKITGNTTVDDLKYHYALNGLSNRLQNVIDLHNDAVTKLGDFRTSGNHTQVSDKTTFASNPGTIDPYTITDYTYDANGNLVKDFNKDIGTVAGSGIAYNHLNLTQTVLLRNTNGSVKGAVNYTYDAKGVRLKKTVTDYGVAGKVITITTHYLHGFVYESRSFVQNGVTTVEYTDVLQFMPQEEGRIRFEKATAATCPARPDRFIFDYFVTDHLGNVRMVLTEQDESLCYINATIEDSRRNNEDDVYDIKTAQVTDKSVVNGASSYSQFEDKLYKVHGGVTGQKTGLGIVLKVMAGDVVKIKVESIYDLPGSGAGGPLTLALTELLTSFIGGAPVAGKGISASDVISAQGSGTGLLDFVSNNPAPPNRAKAFLNWILLDEQFKYVTGDVDAVKDNGGYKLHDKFINTPVVAGKNGYLYIYVSNESNFEVFFDNLAVTHTPGAILEETHYYPYGLVMAGISTRAANGLINKQKFNKGSELQNGEFADGSGLEWYTTNFRMYDPQLGRWHVLDPKPNYFESLYIGMGNNPVKYNDPLGDIVKVDGFTEEEIVNMIQTALKMNKGNNPFSFKDGKMTYDKAKYNALDKKTKRLARNIVAVINSPKTHIIKKANNETITREAKPDKTSGIMQPAGTLGNVAGATIASDDGQTVTHYINMEFFANPDKQGDNRPFEWDGKQKWFLKQTPWLTTFHEAFGHGYYRYVWGSPDQGGLTVRYENELRAMHKMGERAFDDGPHKSAPPYIILYPPR